MRAGLGEKKGRLTDSAAHVSFIGELDEINYEISTSSRSHDADAPSRFGLGVVCLSWPRSTFRMARNATGSSTLPTSTSVSSLSQKGAVSSAFSSVHLVYALRSGIIAQTLRQCTYSTFFLPFISSS